MAELILPTANEPKLNMQFTKDFKVGIRAGAITLTFRVWKRPQAKVGGLYKLHPSGAVRVTHVSVVPRQSISNNDAVAAGFADATALQAFLGTRSGEVFRVAFEFVPDAEIPAPTPISADDVRERLTKMDARSAKPWVFQALAIIEAQPGTRAADLAPQFGWETAKFKANIRKLKKLQLTESLEVGYRLTALGTAVTQK